MVPIKMKGLALKRRINSDFAEFPPETGVFFSFAAIKTHTSQLFVRLFNGKKA
jgi:hypothetical protein